MKSDRSRHIAGRCRDDGGKTAADVEEVRAVATGVETAA